MRNGLLHNGWASDGLSFDVTFKYIDLSYFLHCFKAKQTVEIVYQEDSSLMKNNDVFPFEMMLHVDENVIFWPLIVFHVIYAAQDISYIDLECWQLVKKDIIIEKYKTNFTVWPAPQRMSLSGYLFWCNIVV